MELRAVEDAPDIKAEEMRAAVKAEAPRQKDYQDKLLKYSFDQAYEP